MCVARSSPLRDVIRLSLCGFQARVVERYRDGLRVAIDGQTYVGPGPRKSKNLRNRASTRGPTVLTIEVLPQAGGIEWRGGTG